jgi:hypothetical protein
VDWYRIEKMDKDSGIVPRKIIPITIGCNTRQLLSIFGFNGDFRKGNCGLYPICKCRHAAAKVVFPFGETPTTSTEL